MDLHCRVSSGRVGWLAFRFRQFTLDGRTLLWLRDLQRPRRQQNNRLATERRNQGFEISDTVANGLDWEVRVTKQDLEMVLGNKGE